MDFGREGFSEEEQQMGTKADAADDSNSKRLDSDSSAIAAAAAINIEKEHMFLFFELLTGEIG
ncbi:hypothetical protein CCACVL1_19538, partial [Corchorus capsularis]